MIAKTGRQIDTRAPSSGLTTRQVTVIEQNTSTQVNHTEGYKEITWVDGLPTKIEIWEDTTKAKKLWTTTTTFTDGSPTTVVKVNEDDGITTTTSISWVNGVPISINTI